VASRIGRAVIVLALAGGCQSSFSSVPLTASAPPPTVSPIASAANAAQIEARIAADGIGGLAVGAGSVWVTNFLGMTVSRIDPGTNEVVTTIRIDDPVSGGLGLAEVEYGHDAVWVTNGVDSTLIRIDPSTNEVVARIPVGTPISGGPGTTRPLGMAFTPGSVWVTNNFGTATAPNGGVVRVNVSTNTVVAEVPLGSMPEEGGPGMLTASGELIWVGVSSMKAVVVIDPSTNAVVAEVPSEHVCGYMIEAANAIWVACDGLVLRIDPALRAVVAEIEVGGTGPMALTAGFDSVWPRSRDTGVLARIDPSTDTVIATTPLAPGGPVFEVALEVGFESLWARELDAVIRLRP